MHGCTDWVMGSPVLDVPCIAQCTVTSIPAPRHVSRPCPAPPARLLPQFTVPPEYLADSRWEVRVRAGVCAYVCVVCVCVKNTTKRGLVRVRRERESVCVCVRVSVFTLKTKARWGGCERRESAMRDVKGGSRRCAVNHSAVVAWASCSAPLRQTVHAPLSCATCPPATATTAS